MNLFPRSRKAIPAQRVEGERGTALIEFALVFPMLLVLTLTVVDLSRAFFVKNMLEQAAREGVRTLVVSTVADSANVSARVNQVAGAANIVVKKIIITGPIDQQMGITVESEYSWMFPGLFNLMGAGFTSPVTLKGVAFMRKESI